jgi:hypothetical protein
MISLTTLTKMPNFLDYLTRFVNEFINISAPSIAFFSLIVAFLALAPSLFQGQIAKLGVKLSYSDKISAWLGDTLRILVELRLSTDNQSAHIDKINSLLSSLYTQIYLYKVHTNSLDSSYRISNNKPTSAEEQRDVVVEILMTYFDKVDKNGTHKQDLHKLEYMLVSVVNGIINNEDILADKKKYFKTYFSHKMYLTEYLKENPEYESLFH